MTKSVRNTLRSLMLGTVFLTPALLSGCGVVYTSSAVSYRGTDMDVKVVDMTQQMALVANASPYTPRSLPAEFYQVAGGGNLRGAGALPQAPSFPNLTPGRLQLRPPPAITPAPYQLGTGDTVRLTLARSTEVDPITGASAATTTAQELTVRDDGTISIPAVGPVMVTDMTVEDAEAAVFSRLIDAGIDPQFSLEVAGFKSRRASVGGAVGAPAVVPITLSNLTLGEALTAAGGVQVQDPEFGSIRLYRDGTLYQIPLTDFFAGSQYQKLSVVSGDAIYVDTTYDLERAQAFYESQINIISLERSSRSAALSELSTEIGLRRSALDETRDLFASRAQLGAEPRDYVYLAGEVTKQSRFPLPYGQQASLADVLFEQGGFDATTGSPAQIYVLRADPAVPGSATAWHLDARNAFAFTIAPMFEMRPNDIVFVEQQPITKWNRTLQQSIPSLITTAAAAVN
ncbi:polysaccharide biosynthesis/export family protein [Loktanella salsilacus]|uniref:polysaccharide biosynthesis/export family protein n=1 Tax=Loktanella salsilacus TaxID=195913 RepID=UPI0030FC5B44